MSIRILTAGESHGKALSLIIDGLPAGIPVSTQSINRHLERRQQGYGRGKRMQIEKDTAEVLSGVRFGKTTGAPVSLLIKNRDWVNWEAKLSPFGEPKDIETVSIPRPGHADLPAVQKYLYNDIRNSIERSSARETAARVAAGAILRAFLDQFAIRIESLVESIGGVYPKDKLYKKLCAKKYSDSTIDAFLQSSEKSPVKVIDRDQELKIIDKIKSAKKSGDTLGGTFVLIIRGVKPGLGAFSQLDRKLDAAISFALMSLNAVKSVEIGIGFSAAELPGSLVHDEIMTSPEMFSRRTNHAGGIEGGMSNGEQLLIRAAMKPIATLMKPLRSLDLKTFEPVEARRERSDFTAVPACSVIAESLVAFPLSNAILEKFGGDSVPEIIQRYEQYYRDLPSVLRGLFGSNNGH